MKQKTRIFNGFSFTLLLLLSALFLFPIYLVIINSFKSKFNIVGTPFEFPNEDTFVGIENYINGIQSSGIVGAFFRTLFITVASVLAIVIFTSMTAWYITRVKSKLNKIVYYLFLFSMIVPFQMVMFTMTSVCINLGLNNVIGIIPVYLGFGSGLSVFMFSGFVKSLPKEIEEAAMIDGCSPLKTFFMVVFPILIGLLSLRGEPVGKFGFIDLECFVRFPFGMKDLGTHVPCAQPQSFFRTALSDLIADREKFVHCRQAFLRGDVMSHRL